MGENKRKKLFEVYAHQLRALRDLGVIESGFADGDHLLCPICLDAFTREALDKDSPNPLTLEDAPPKSLGGKANTLTCKRCNNNYGGSYDSALVQGVQLKYHRDSPGDDSPINLEVGDQTLRGVISNKTDGLYDMTISGSNNNPANIDRLNVAIEIGSRTYKLLPRESRNKSLPDAALVKSAYIQIFEQLGYVAILSPSMQKLRNQIMNPGQVKIAYGSLLTGQIWQQLGNEVYFATSGIAKDNYVVVGIQLKYRSNMVSMAYIYPFHLGSNKNIVKHAKLKKSLTFQKFDRRQFFEDKQQMLYWSEIFSSTDS